MAEDNSNSGSNSNAMAIGLGLLGVAAAVVAVKKGVFTTGSAKKSGKPWDGKKRPASTAPKYSFKTKTGKSVKATVGQVLGMPKMWSEEAIEQAKAYKLKGQA
jgi:hypothetical protein